MSSEFPRECQDLAELQAGVLSRRQALAGGMSPDGIDWGLRSGRLQTLHRGVYAVFTGRPPRAAMLWAAVLRAGPGAVLSHQTAAELYGLTDRPSPRIHVMIAQSRRVESMAGVVIHRSSRLGEVTHPTMQPPRVRLEETLLDLVSQSTAFDSAFNVLCSACQRGLTKPGLIAEAMANRTKLH
jgi:predicted transcriptional regulator of viral defense system